MVVLEWADEYLRQLILYSTPSDAGRTNIEHKAEAVVVGEGQIEDGEVSQQTR